MASLHLDGDSMLHRFTAWAEIDRLVSSAVQLADQVFDISHITIKAGRTQADKTHQMAIRSADLTVVKPFGKLLAALILALTRASVVNLDRNNVGQRRLFRIMLEQPDVRSSRMAGDNHATHLGNFVDYLLGRQMYIGEVKAAGHFICHAEYQHVAVVGL